LNHCIHCGRLDQIKSLLASLGIFGAGKMKHRQVTAAMVASEYQENRAEQEELVVGLGPTRIVPVRHQQQPQPPTQILINAPLLISFMITTHRNLESKGHK
jgi:hypothetical protein